MKATPLRIFIFLLIAVLIACSQISLQDNWGAGFLMLGAAVLLIPSLLVEIFLTIQSKRGKKTSYLTSLILIPIIIVGSWKALNWMEDVKPEIYLPENYDKDIVIIIYDIPGAKSLRGNLWFPRKRKMKFDDSGVLCTSSKRVQSRLYKTKVFSSKGEKIFPPNGKNFHLDRGKIDGKEISVIDLVNAKWDTDRQDSIIHSGQYDLDRCK